MFVGGWPDRVSGFPNGEMDSTSSFDVFTSAFLSLCLSSSSAAAAAIQGTVQLFGPIGNARTTESYHGDNVLWSWELQVLFTVNQLTSSGQQIFLADKS